MKALTLGPRLLWFMLWYAFELVRANVAVVKDNVTPGQDSTPGIVRLDTWCRTEAEATLLATLIALAPGTLAIGAAKRTDGLHVLYVHGMYSASADELRSELRVLERHMLTAIRLRGFDQADPLLPAALQRGGDE